MTQELRGQRVGILAADGVERIELEQPRGALHGAGASTEIISLRPGEIQARQFDMESAGTFPVDRVVADVSADDYDALLLPGGTVNPDQLRMNDDAVAQRPTGFLCRHSGPVRKSKTAHLTRRLSALRRRELVLSVRAPVQL